MTDNNFLWIELIADKDICVLISKSYAGAVILRKEIDFNANKKIFVYIRMETEKEIQYKSTIMEMRNIIKNQERVIEELMLKVLDIKIENEEIAEVENLKV
jgi:hypothetical protein